MWPAIKGWTNWEFLLFVLWRGVLIFFYLFIYISAHGFCDWCDHSEFGSRNHSRVMLAHRFSCREGVLVWLTLQIVNPGLVTSFPFFPLLVAIPLLNPYICSWTQNKEWGFKSIKFIHTMGSILNQHFRQPGINHFSWCFKHCLFFPPFSESAFSLTHHIKCFLQNTSILRRVL